MTVCPRCNQDKDESAFPRDKSKARGFASRCSDCKRVIDRIHRYGLDEVTYDALYDAQCGLCAICDRPLEGVGRIVVDHNHSCCPGSRTCGRCVRGLLCSTCNTAIGLLQEDPETIIAAAEYLNARSSIEPCPSMS